MKNKHIKILVLITFIGSIFFLNYVLGSIDFNTDNALLDNKILQQEVNQLREELTDTLALSSLEDTYVAYDYLNTTVLLRDIYDFHNTITIKYGKDANIQKGMAVVSAQGLVGKVIKVNKNTSIVKLITSSNINISVSIDDNYGILNDYNLITSYLVADNFSNYEIIMKDDEVYTSGLGLIPAGLYIGKVINVKDINENIEQSVSISSNVDFNNLKYVAIIRGIKSL